METVFSKSRSELDKERMGFSLFVAIAIHILIIFGVGFTVLQKHSASRSIDITLTNHASEQKPEQADFIAQSNQQGGGETNPPQEPASNSPALNSQQNKPLLQTAQTRQTALERELLTTSAAAESQLPTNRLTPEQVDSAGTSSQDNQAHQPEALNNLQARLDTARQAYSEIPNTRRLTSINAKAADEAAYLFYWIQRAEQIGNQHYPEEARRKNIYGELQLAVTLLPDGSIENIDIIRSSGQRVLDMAAIRTVRLASPFAPFHDSMRKYDKYEIIRTWRYIPGNRLQTEK